jgi:CBS domain-containing protein
VVSDQDIIRRVPLVPSVGGRAPDPTALLSVIRVAGIMAYAPVTLEDTTPMPEALRLMARSHATAIPVLHEGRLVGMFTVSNALQGALEILRLERKGRSEEVPK